MMGTLTLAPERRALVAAKLGLVPPEPVKVTPQPPAAPSQPNVKARRRAEVIAIHAELAEAFPDVIAAWRHGPRVVLKVGIHNDIRALLPERRRAAISTFLHHYTKNPGYRRLLKPGVPRVDLDGKECGTVAEGEAARQPEAKGRA